MTSLARIAASGRAKSAQAPEDAPAPVLPSKVHAAVLDTFTAALAYLAPNVAGANIGVRVMFGMLQNSQGMMVDALSRMPEATLRAYLIDVRGRVDAALSPDA